MFLKNMHFYVPIVFPQTGQHIWPFRRARDTPVLPQRVPSTAVPSRPCVVVGPLDGPPRRPTPRRAADEGPPRHAALGNPTASDVASDRWRAQSRLDRPEAAPMDPAAAIGRRHVRGAYAYALPSRASTRHGGRPCPVVDARLCHRLVGRVVTVTPLPTIRSGDARARTGGTQSGCAGATAVKSRVTLTTSDRGARVEPVPISLFRAGTAANAHLLCRTKVGEQIPRHVGQRGATPSLTGAARQRCPAQSPARG